MEIKLLHTHLRVSPPGTDEAERLGLPEPDEVCWQPCFVVLSGDTNVEFGYADITTGGTILVTKNGQELSIQMPYAEFLNDFRKAFTFK